MNPITCATGIDRAHLGMIPYAFERAPTREEAMIARRQLLFPGDDNYTSPSVAVERLSLLVIASALCLASSLR